MERVTMTPRFFARLVSALAHRRARMLLSPLPEMQRQMGLLQGMESMVMTHWENGWEILERASERTEETKRRVRFNQVRSMKKLECPECGNMLKQVTWDQSKKLQCACGWSEWVEISF